MNNMIQNNQCVAIGQPIINNNNYNNTIMGYISNVSSNSHHNTIMGAQNYIDGHYNICIGTGNIIIGHYNIVIGHNIIINDNYRNITYSCLPNIKNLFIDIKSTHKLMLFTLTNMLPFDVIRQIVYLYHDLFINYYKNKIPY